MIKFSLIRHMRLLWLGLCCVIIVECITLTVLFLIGIINMDICFKIKKMKAILMIQDRVKSNRDLYHKMRGGPTSLGIGLCFKCAINTIQMEISLVYVIRMIRTLFVWYELSYFLKLKLYSKLWYVLAYLYVLNYIWNYVWVMYCYLFCDIYLQY